MKKKPSKAAAKKGGKTRPSMWKGYRKKTASKKK